MLEWIPTLSTYSSKTFNTIDDAAISLISLANKFIFMSQSVGTTIPLPTQDGDAIYNHSMEAVIKALT